MSSKNKDIKSMSLVFITTGSTKFPFDRILSSVDRILSNTKNAFFVIAQTGGSNYKWLYKNIKEEVYIKPEEISRYIKNAKKIISHGGPVSIYQIIKYAKYVPLVIPRLAKFGEHVDDHQLYFSKFLKNQLPSNLKKYFVTEENSNKVIENYLNEKNIENDLKKYLFKHHYKSKVISEITNFIEKNVK